MKYLLTIRYVGTEFFGFQVQPNVRTVQGVLTKACEALFGTPCAVSGCSRTDSGVHAIASRVTVEPSKSCAKIPAQRLPFAIAPYLPDDLSVMEATLVDDSFHVRHDVKSKEYRYYLRANPVYDPFWVNRAWQYPYPFPEDALSLMNDTASALCGTHDFSAFMAQGSPVLSAVRNLISLSVKKEGDMYCFIAIADGFLYNMVRILVGTLVDVGMHRLTKEEVLEALKTKVRARSGQTAPPQGLYLYEVIY